MTKTTNYQLPQWAANNPIRREDFNQAMASIEAGLDGVQAAADAARTTAAELPYVIGSYIGDGATSWRDIAVGFRPRFLIITAQGAASTAGSAANVKFALVGGNTSITLAYLTATGFQVRTNENYPYPQLNLSGSTYYYIAFR